MTPLDVLRSRGFVVRNMAQERTAIGYRLTYYSQSPVSHDTAFKLKIALADRFRTVAPPVIFNPRNEPAGPPYPFSHTVTLELEAA